MNAREALVQDFNEIKKAMSTPAEFDVALAAFVKDLSEPLKAVKAECSMLLEQHAANHSGLLFNFFICDERLIKQYNVTDMPVNLEIIHSLTPDQLSALEDAKRPIVRITEMPVADEHGNIDRKIDFYLNQNQEGWRRQHLHWLYH